MLSVSALTTCAVLGVPASSVYVISPVALESSWDSVVIDSLIVVDIPPVAFEKVAIVLASVGVSLSSFPVACIIST